MGANRCPVMNHCVSTRDDTLLLNGSTMVGCFWVSGGLPSTDESLGEKHPDHALSVNQLARGDHGHRTG